MARVSNTLIGKSSGSIGNATFSTWKGINVLKEKAVSVANPKTDLQQMNRSAMRQAVAIGRSLYAVIFYGFKNLATKQSSFNAFCSAARRLAFNYAAPPTAALVPSDLLISKGSITTTAITSTTQSLAAGSIEVTYPDTITGPGQSASDVALAACYNETRNTWSVATEESRRATTSIHIQFPASTAQGDTLRMYLGFYSEVTGGASNSVSTTEAADA